MGGARSLIIAVRCNSAIAFTSLASAGAIIWHGAVKLRDELLDRDVSYTLPEVRVLTEQYPQTPNRTRPHSPLGPDDLQRRSA